MSRAERAVHATIAQPSRKAAAMLRNRAGMAESLERQALRWRLRLSQATRPAPEAAPG